MSSPVVDEVGTSTLTGEVYQIAGQIDHALAARDVLKILTRQLEVSRPLLPQKLKRVLRRLLIGRLSITPMPAAPPPITAMSVVSSEALALCMGVPSTIRVGGRAQARPREIAHPQESLWQAQEHPTLLP
ncbi:hypothetical protein [Pseudomonas phage vB_PaS-HSN4]|nr:hypothetical protein [Pseudomonas phage vB_PaS-HSN4]